jgi:methanethiol S-methyltransferase
MAGLLTLAYGALAYALFLGAFVYAIAFIGNLPMVPKTIDSGMPGPLLPSLVVNALLLGLFAVQHSVMARPAFKRWWTKMVPWPLERSTFVLAASLVLILMYWLWQPMPQPVWTLTDPLAVGIVMALFAAGWLMVLVSTFLISHWQLFGLAQVLARFQNKSLPPPSFQTPGFYKWVRHPIYLGFIVAFWAAPEMTYGRLLFAVATTGYILVGIYLEERDLITLFGDRYRSYREQVRMLLPLPRRNTATQDTPMSD